MKVARLIVYEGDESWIKKTLANSLKPLKGKTQGVALITANGTISLWELNAAELTLFACEETEEDESLYGDDGRPKGSPYEGQG